MKTISEETKKAVYDYHTDLHTHDKGIGGSIHKRVREKFNLTSDQVVEIINEFRNPPQK